MRSALPSAAHGNSRDVLDAVSRDTTVLRTE